MTNETRANLAADLDELRRLIGLTYRELACRTGYARSTLNDALTGRRFPRLDTVLAIVRACGGDVTGWRERWAAASRAAPTTRAPQNLPRLLGIPEDHVVHVVVTWRQPGHDAETAPSMSWQSTRPS